MALALKNGVDGFSAGTRVELIDEHGLVDISKQHDVTVYPVGQKPDQDIYIDTTTDNLVKLRNQVDVVPVNNRHARRADKHNSSEPRAWATSSSKDN